MQDFSHLQSQGMDPPTLLERMGVIQGKPMLLERMSLLVNTLLSYVMLNSNTLVLLGWMTILKMKSPAKTLESDYHPTNLMERVNLGLTTSPLKKWTTSLTASGMMKSQNSKPSPTSYRSLIAISQGQNEPKMQLLNTMQKPWMKSNLSLLQWLREENLLETCWGPGETVMNQCSLEGPLTMALKLMNLSPNLAENLRDPGSTLHELPLMTVSTLIVLPTRNAEFLSQRCPLQSPIGNRLLVM